MGILGFVYVHASKGYFWFRAFGYGLHIADRNLHPPLFSERNGYYKVLRIRNWAIRVLRPNNR